MGNAIHNKDKQINYLSDRLNMLLTVIDSIDPEETGVEDIDRLLNMVDELQTKLSQFRNDWDKE